MKVLMMAGAFPPAPSGGAEKQCLAQSLALAERGHEVMVVTEWLNRRHLRRETRGGVRILRLGFLLPLFSAALKGRQILERRRLQARGKESNDHPWLPACEQPVPRWLLWVRWWREWSFIVEVAWAVWTQRLQADVVHVNSSEWIAGFSHWVAEKLHAPVVCKEACGMVLRWPERRDVPWLSRWEKRRMQCAYIAITPYIRKELKQAGIPSNRIFEVPNGVRVPEAMARPDESSLAVYGGNFSQGAGFKGFDVLLKAWGLAHREAPDMKLHLYGAGDSSAWQRLAREEGAEESVVFQGESPDLLPIFEKAGFLILPSRVEGLSNVLLEAQSVGLPAIVSDIPGNCSVVRDGVNGLVVPVGDVPALAAAMLKMHRSPDLRARLGRAARQNIEMNFSISRVAEQLEAAYQKLQSTG